MKDFYEKNLSLSATFSVSGLKKSENGSSLMRVTSLCSKEKLEETMSGYDRVFATTLYSLQNVPSTKHDISSTDWHNKHDFPTVPHEYRFPIKSSLAIEARKTWNERNPDPVYSSYVNSTFDVSEKKVQKSTAKSFVIKSDQHSLKDAFAKATPNDCKMEVDGNEQALKKRSRSMNVIFN